MLFCHCIIYALQSKGFPHPIFSSQFPIASATDHHKLCGLAQHQFVVLEFWRSEVHNGFHQAKINWSMLVGLHSFWRFQQRIHYLPSSVCQKLPAFLYLRPLSPSLKPETQHFKVFLTLILLLPSFTYKDLKILDHICTSCLIKQHVQRL